MASAAATSAPFSVFALPPEPGAKTSGMLGGTFPVNVDERWTVSKPSWGLLVKTNAQAPPKINGIKVAVMDKLKADDEVTLSPPRNFINQLTDWSKLIAAIATIFLAAEKQRMMLDWKPKHPDDLTNRFGIRRIVKDGYIFCQNFSIRSYEIGADRTVSIETLMNHLQETALNHVKNVGLLGDGFGSTPAMLKRNLIWVVTKMQIHVDQYPTWGDVVQVDTWVAASGKNGMRRDWLFRDSKTGHILTRASGISVMMNKETRRLAKIPDEIRAEIDCYFLDMPPILDEHNTKLPKLDDNTADYIRSGLTPKWNDLDVNQHVNNVKYVGWILESAPSLILETHELASMTLEYRRECRKDSVVQSLTSVSANDDGNFSKSGYVQCQHLLRLENGGEIVKGRTEWRPKNTNGIGSVGQLPAENA